MVAGFVPGFVADFIPLSSPLILCLVYLVFLCIGASLLKGACSSLASARDCRCFCHRNKWYLKGIGKVWGLWWRWCSSVLFYSLLISWQQLSVHKELLLCKATCCAEGGWRTEAAEIWKRFISGIVSSKGVFESQSSSKSQTSIIQEGRGPVLMKHLMNGYL